MKSKRLTQVRAGRLVRAVIYTQAMPSDAPHVRAAKSKISSKARERLNRKASWVQLEMLIAANFDRRDLFVTLTYRDEPKDRAAAVARCKCFLRTLAQSRKARGEPLKYIKNAEHLRDDGTEGRWHHHLILNATGPGDYEEIRALWSRYGDDVDIQPLLDGGLDFEARARYMAKERQPVGKNCWTPSRNLERPEPHSELVDDALTLAAPPGAVILESDTQTNGWGSFVYIKYLLPYSPPKPKPKRRPSYFSGLG